MEPTLEGLGATRVGHLRDYWRIVWQGRYTVLTIMFLIVALAVLKVVLATPVYRATASVEIKPEARSILPGQQQWLGAESRSWVAEEMYFNTQLEILKSRDLAERVFRRLGLSDHPRYAELADPVGAFAASVRVSPRVNTRLVEVSVLGPDPAESRDWVNEIVETYVQRNVDEAVSSFDAIMDEIRQSMTAFRTDLNAADSRRLEVTGEGELLVPEDQQEILKANLDAYNRQLTQTDVEIGTMQAELDSLQRLRDQGGDLLSLPRFSNDEAVRRLRADRETISRALSALEASGKRNQHPEYVSKRRELQEVDASLDERIDRLSGELRAAYRQGVLARANLRNNIEATEQELYQLQLAASEYDILKTDAESKRRVYDVVAETTEQLRIGAQLIAMNNNVAVLDAATLPRVPISPRKFLTIGFGLFVGTLLGIGAVLFLDYLDNTIRTPDDVEHHLGLNVLAIVPRYRDIQDHAVREAYQSLRTSVLFSSQNLEKRVLLFTSAGPQEGKSSTVNHVARALASAGDRVVVIDCDLRRPTVDKHLNLSRVPGLTNYLVEGKDDAIEPYVHSTEFPNLEAIPAGAIPPNPAELVGTARFRNLIANLKEKYDWVVIDSPPVANLADTVVLASIAEMLVMVIKHNQNDRDQIRRCLKRLRDVHGEIAGAVLNAMVERSAYGYYYNYEYGPQEPKRGRRSRRSGGGGDSKKGDRDSSRVAL